MSIGKKSKRAVDAIREKIYARDGFVCVASAWGSPCRGRLTIQHAVKRGMGGSNLWDTPKYLRTMCAKHNDEDASHADFRRRCLLNGWSISRNEAIANPEADVPVLYPDGRWYLLDDAFNREPISDVGAALLRAERADYVWEG